MRIESLLLKRLWSTVDHLFAETYVDISVALVVKKSVGKESLCNRPTRKFYYDPVPEL